MPKKFIQNIQKLIDNTDSKRDLGSISETNISNFKFTPKNLVTTPISEQIQDGTNKIKRSNIISVWNKRSFNHDRGSFVSLNLYEFFVALKILNTSITSVNGDFTDVFISGNINASYTTRTTISEISNISLNIVTTPGSSLSVYIQHENETKATKIFASSQLSLSSRNDRADTAGGFNKGTVFLPFTATGVWEITILYYHQESPSSITVSGDLGSFINSTELSTGLNITTNARRIAYSQDRGNNGIESVFIDGANGPALSNIIYWNKLNQFSNEIGGNSIEGYNLKLTSTEQLDFSVVSGWGNSSFVVAEDKTFEFPIAGTFNIPGPTVTSYQISGTFLEENINQTIVTVSGTFSGNISDNIYMERSLVIDRIIQNATTGQIISGTHNNVKVGETYTYEIEAFNQFGNINYSSDKISVVAGDLVPPGLVTNLAGTGSLKAIKLTWTNPTNIDLKGVHVFDVPIVISGTTKPIATIIKGSNTTIPEEVVVNSVSSGTLIDAWPYDLYLATFDFAGNSSTEAMPTVSVTTDVEIKTSREGQRIEMDTSTNQLRFYDINDVLILTIGEDAVPIGLGSSDGIKLENLATIYHDFDIDENTGLENPGIISEADLTGDLTGLNARSVRLLAQTHGATIANNQFATPLDIILRDEFSGSPTGPGIYTGIHFSAPLVGTASNVFSAYFEDHPVFIEKSIIADGGLADADDDTKVQVEESADEDFIRFDTGGTQRAIISGANMGIGVDGPIGRLHVRDLVSDDIAIILENEDARAGIELETQGATANGEGILNFGIHTNRAITEKWTDPLGMWFRIDTRNSAQVFVWFTELAGSDTETALMSLEAGGDLGIGISNPTAQLHIDQSSTTAAQPVLLLDQADISEEMIEFNTTIGTGNAIEAIGAKTLTTTHFIKITIPGGLTRYIPCGTIA